MAREEGNLDDLRALLGNDIAIGAYRDASEAEPDDDLAFALIQMRAEVLERINEAVRRCDDGTYGYCVDCGEVIASSRLRAMPFAVRCRDCEETREDEQHRERVQLQRVPSGLGLAILVQWITIHAFSVMASRASDLADENGWLLGLANLRRTSTTMHRARPRL